MDLGSGPEDVKVFLPKGRLSRRERERAERLDAYLLERMPEIEAEMRADGTLDAREMKKWHALGQRLDFVDDVSLVDRSDVDEGHIWRAIREYCPAELRPAPRRGETEDSSARREGTALDHYHHCYLLGKQDESILKWLTRWTDWFAIVESPGILRDSRVLPLVLQAISGVGRQLSRSEFRKIMKELRGLFSTKPVYRDTSVLEDDIVEREITAVVNGNTDSAR